MALPGHADGQMGLLVRPPGTPPSLLVADATWLSEGIRDQRGAPWPTTIIFASTQLAHQTLRALHDAQLRMPDLRMIPSHCPAHWPTP